MGVRADRAREIGGWSLLNALWLPLTAQDAALMTIAVPAALVKLAPGDYRSVLAVLASVAALCAMLVPPFAGWLSDNARRAGRGRRGWVLAGLVIDVVALAAMGYATDLRLFCALLVLAVFGANVAIAAYQALLPELVPRAQWGLVSGIRGAITLAGTVVGLIVAGAAPEPRITFLAMSGLVAISSFSLAGVSDERIIEDTVHARVRDRHDFVVVFWARAFIWFGLTLLMTFVLYFFRDVLHFTNPTAGTSGVALFALLGAVASSIVLGMLSDRVPRRLVTAYTGLPMALAAIGFALAPTPSEMFLFAIFFGIGFGGVLSAGWAIALDSIPELSDVARDLGIWGIATNLPNVIAPLVGGWILFAFHGSRVGYQFVFGLAGISFLCGSLVILNVGKRPLSPIWNMPLVWAAFLSNAAYVPIAYRFRGWGRLPRKRGPSLLVANHQHDLEAMALVSRTWLQSSWRHPVFSATGRRMHEPGFLAVRLPWLRNVLRTVNASPLFRALGMMPLENDLRSRSLLSLAWSVQRRHGVTPLVEIFPPAVLANFAPETTTDDLYAARNFDAAQREISLRDVREPFRREIIDETRAHINEDLARIEEIVRHGATFYLTPEGHYTADGSMGKFLASYDRLAPFATIYLVGTSYDPFAAKRLSMLYHIVELRDRSKARETLAAARPVTTTHLLGAWLDKRGDVSFAEEEAESGVEAALHSLPPAAFVDPELKHAPRKRTREALHAMIEMGLLRRNDDGTYEIAQRTHPQFPRTRDIYAYQSRFLAETLEGLKTTPDLVPGNQR